MTSEKAFTSQVRELALATGWKFYHTHDSRRSDPGFPDCVLVHAEKRLTLFWELKVGPSTQKRYSPTPAQTEWLETLRAAGQHAVVMRPEDWPVIEHILTKGLNDE